MANVVIMPKQGQSVESCIVTEFIKKVGDKVEAGEPIAIIGNSGELSSGPHLHFETRYHGKPFDPLRVVDFDNNRLRDTLITLKKHYFSIYSHYGMTDKESKAASGRIVYVVKKGDSLGRIAGKYGTTVNKLCKLNKLTAKSVIRPGQRIIVR